MEKELSRLRTCCFTGHRRMLHPEETVRGRLVPVVEMLIGEEYTIFESGMALGFDMLAAEVVLKLREQYPISLVCVLPCPPEEQVEGWSTAERRRYYDILSQSDDVVVVSENRSPSCMKKRDRYLVDLASACVAYCYQETGGTVYTVRYAERCGIEVIRI